MTVFRRKGRQKMPSLDELVRGLKGRTIAEASIEEGWITLDFTDGSFAAIDWNGAKVELADPEVPLAPKIA